MAIPYMDEDLYPLERTFFGINLIPVEVSE
jgi:hypothetical protein